MTEARFDFQMADGRPSDSRFAESRILALTCGMWDVGTTTSNQFCVASPTAPPEERPQRVVLPAKPAKPAAAQILNLLHPKLVAGAAHRPFRGTEPRSQRGAAAAMYELGAKGAAAAASPGQCAPPGGTGPGLCPQAEGASHASMPAALVLLQRSR
jgi:hypothetical protein